MSELIRCGRVSCESYWSKRKVRILLQEEDDENTEIFSMTVIGDVPELGSLNKNFMKMKLITKKVFEKVSSYWEYTFFIDVDIGHFYYTYVRFYRHKKQAIFDRQRYRELATDQATTEAKARDLKNPLYLKYNCYIKVDLKMDTGFLVHQLDPSIYFGPYPQLQENFDALRNHEVLNIVNLMSKEELNASLVDLEMHRKMSQKSNSTYHSLDFDLTSALCDRKERVKTIAQKIHQLLLKNESIFLCDIFGFEKIREVLSYLILNHLPSKQAALNQNRLLSLTL